MAWLIACLLFPVLQVQPVEEPPTTRASVDVLVGDLDGNGRLDLLLQDIDGSLLEWATSSAGRGTTRRSVTLGAPTGSAASFGVSPTAQVDPDSPLGRLLESTAEGPIVTAHDLFASLLVGVYVSLIEAQYVNDNVGEVDSADVADFSLLGRDVSTTAGDVTHTGAVLTADQGVFGLNVTVSPNYATVSGGRFNSATSGGATVGGGDFNSAAGYSAVVAGGSANDAFTSHTTVGGGYNCNATAIYATVGGGYLNNASGADSTVPGGHRNEAQGFTSFAAGRRAKAVHQGAFVWGDSSLLNKSSSAVDQFNVYAAGGTRIFSNSAGTAGVLLAPGGNSWSAVSDRDSKEHFEPVDARAVLDAVTDLPITTWNYKSQGEAVRHMGPMAQDFRAAFGLGVSERFIDTVDPDGVALAAIQGLRAEKDEEVAALKAEVAELKARLDELLSR